MFDVVVNNLHRFLRGLFVLMITLPAAFPKGPSTVSKLTATADTIHIALAVDSKSAKDALILAASVVNSAVVPDNTVFHIAATGPDIIHAESLAVEMRDHFSTCFPTVTYDIRAFLLPPDRGFGQQLERKKTTTMSGGSHWVSDTGADMVRFYFAEIFPNVSRLLYLDNDIIVGCCLEEVWSTPFSSSQAVGIALDDLKWATTTQFQRHYNASYPAVYTSIRRDGGKNTAPLTEEEFVKALPRYPNDGVLLIDVMKYNSMKILENAEAIAAANNRDGIYVVGLGTQQFTVLAMHDKWIELTPRANLRRFPDMARGYLMWFYYNGFLHSAGHHKSRNVCVHAGSDNEHQLGMYTHWANSIRFLRNHCPAVRLVATDMPCADHIPVADNYTAFLSFAKKAAMSMNDKDSYLLRIGKYFDPVKSELDVMVFRDTKWSGVVIDRDIGDSSDRVIDGFISDSERRNLWRSYKFDFCDSTRVGYNYTTMLHRGLSHPQVGCVSILDHFKSIRPNEVKKDTLKHWQVVGISIDLPYEKRLFDDVYTVGALDALDMTFLRPKFVQIRIDTAHNPSLDITDYHYAAEHISSILRRHGYSVGSDSGRPEGLLVWGLFFNSLQI